MNNNTPTPETDALHEQRREVHAAYFMMTSHARKLERERDNYSEQADGYLVRLGETQERMIDAERERDELAESILNLSHPNCQILLRERDEAREAYVVAIDQLVVAQSQNRKERALADRLAEACRMLMVVIGEPTAEEKDCWATVDEINAAWNSGNAALTAWKEARK